jgi:hypothetical protein
MGIIWGLLKHVICTGTTVLCKQLLMLLSNVSWPTSRHCLNRLRSISVRLASHSLTPVFCQYEVTLLTSQPQCLILHCVGNAWRSSKIRTRIPNCRHTHCPWVAEFEHHKYYCTTSQVRSTQALKCQFNLLRPEIHLNKNQLPYSVSKFLGFFLYWCRRCIYLQLGFEGLNTAHNTGVTPSVNSAGSLLNCWTNFHIYLYYQLYSFLVLHVVESPILYMVYYTSHIRIKILSMFP